MHVQGDHLQQLCTKLLSLQHSGTSQPQSLLGTSFLKSLQDQTSPRPGTVITFSISTLICISSPLAHAGLGLTSTVPVLQYHHGLSTGFREQPVANICEQKYNMIKEDMGWRGGLYLLVDIVSSQLYTSL